MNAYQLIEDHLRYHQWANVRMVDWLKQQSGDRLHEPLNTSFRTLNKVLHHVLEAETYYFSILSKKEVAYYNELMNEEVFHKLTEMDQNILSWYLQQDPSIVDQIISLKRSPHEERYAVATLVTHMVNHGTYHRGQLIDMRHRLGISDPPKTDYYWMFAEKLMGNK